MSVIELDELGPPLELPLTAKEGQALASSGVVSAVPSPYRPGIWLAGAAGKVGAARIGAVEVFIRPKVEIDRLLFLLGYASHGGVWRQGTVDVASAADIIPVVAQALGRHTERAVHQGLLPGYVLVEENSQMLRGRLRESAQLHARHGLPLPLEIRHDEFTIDIPENQILRTACERMLSVPRVARRSTGGFTAAVIDLSQPPDQLIGQMGNLAELVASMAMSHELPVRPVPRRSRTDEEIRIARGAGDGFLAGSDCVATLSSDVAVACSWGGGASAVGLLAAG